MVFNSAQATWGMPRSRTAFWAIWNSPELGLRPSAILQMHVIAWSGSWAHKDNARWAK